MEKGINISVIICTYNRDQYIYSTLKKIAENNFPSQKYEIILVNNNSTDHTSMECERFQAAFPEIQFHYFVENAQGLSFARNRGIREAKGEMLVFLDDDAFVGKNYLNQLDQYMEKYPEMAAFGGKITPLYENGKPPVWMSKWSYSWVSALDLGDQVRLFKRNSFPIGANMGICKNGIARYGYFNTELGRNKTNLLAGEEKDFFNRLKGNKEKIYYLPDIEVQHVIPERRTTTEFIKRLALGIGESERLRTLAISKKQFFKRIFIEGIKWGATIIIFIGYCCCFLPSKGIILLLFRRYVTQGLFVITKDVNQRH